MKKKIHAGFICLLLAAALMLNLMGCGARKMGYEDQLFDESLVHRVDITISQEDWETMMKSPLDKLKVYVTASIDGEAYEDVCLSPKGNASLFFVAAQSSQRFSFKLNFNSIDPDRTYHGLDEFVLNNSYEDPSYLRDYAANWLFRQEGVPVTLTSFTQLYINGELYGLYMAEEVEKNSFIERVFDGEGNLYKPESAVLKARDQGFIDEIREALANGTQEECYANLNIQPLPADYTTPGADLKYTDDDPNSYSDILGNAVTAADEASNQAVIQALKNLSQGNYAEAIDTDEVIRYFAVHNFICNSDSYTSTMLHNYMLYEKDGILSMIPWDYNSALRPERAVTGGTDRWSWTEIVNMGIDSPTYQEVALEDRPMLGWIFTNEESYAAYEKQLSNVAGLISSGEFAKAMDDMYERIRPCIAQDPTAFYTLEQSDQSYQELVSFCELRAESIQLQLNGRLEKVTKDQTPSARVTSPSLPDRYDLAD